MQVSVAETRIPLLQWWECQEDELIDAENELSKAKDTLESQKEDAIAQATKDCSKAIANAEIKLEQNKTELENKLSDAESGLNDAQSTYDNATDVAGELETAKNELEASTDELTNAQNALDALVNGNGAGGATLVVEADGSATLYISEASEQTAKANFRSSPTVVQCRHCQRRAFYIMNNCYLEELPYSNLSEYLANIGKYTKASRYRIEEKRPVELSESIKELAEKSGVNVRLIQNVELGTSEAGNMAARNLIALADALDVDAKMLLDQFGTQS